jgi:hypothetical protein
VKEVIEMETVGLRSANALPRELVVRVEESSSGSSESVYEVLADLRTHAVWAGEQQGKRARLLSVEAPEGAVRVGTEFHTTGLDPMGTFADRSVVTEATPGKVFEFVTEGRLTTKKGRSIDMTDVHRYELTPRAEGCRIAYTMRVARISQLAGMLAIFGIPGLRALGLKATKRVARRGVRNLARMAEG